ncbi:MAG: CHASE2 domain-containing protein, partial [Leptospirales bacterium]|nr:CHASE2 domain-containing protein [Leptospirales bacterium]
SKKVDEKDYYKYESVIDSRTVKIAYPIPDLMKAAHAFGFVNRDTDIDGAVRKVRLVQFFEGRLYFNLALVMLANTCGVALNDIDIIAGEKIVLKNALHPLSHEKGDINIPIDKNGMMYVYWTGGKREEAFKAVPFYGLVEYPDIIGQVNKWIADLAGPAEHQLAEQEKQDMDAARSAYDKAETAAERRELRAGIVELMRLDRERKESLKEIFREDTEDLEDAAQYENIIRAIDVVLAVESLRDNITVTGLTATGTVDIGQTPLEQEFAMVGVYHNTINTIVQGKHIHIAPKWFNYIMMLFIALIMGFSVQRLSAKKSILAIILSFLFLNIVVIFTFIFGNIWLDLLGTWLACLVPSASIAATKLIKEESQKQFIKSAFGHYLSPSIIDQIVDSPDSLELGGEEKEITIFFSDVAKFSTISEKLTPHELVSLLNEYLSEMTDIILDSGGTIDKYEGDAIIAFFGAPQAFEDHALRCCMAAIDQKKRLAVMQEEWRKAGRDVLTIRIGINTGVAVIGNMGSKTRFNYTMMGDSVNLASRIEGANKAYNTSAMITGSTYEYVKDAVEARKLDIIRVVGKKEPVPVYELLDVKGALSDNMYELLDKYGKGLELYNAGQWKKAQDEFKKALKIMPDDGPSLTYTERCGLYAVKPPPEDWGGIFQLEEK